MKRSLFLTGILATVLVLSMAIIGCGDKPGDDNGGDPDLEGTITISPDTDVFINTELTATYSGTETVSYQWKKDGTDIDDETSETYTPTEAGSYTVTVSATGYSSKTSAAVTILPIFTDITAMSAYIASLANNTATTPYIIKLNVATLPDGSANSDSYSDLQKVFTNNPNKYVSLDLSDSTFTSIGNSAFRDCTGLSNITIPDSVITIETYAFRGCTSFTNITIPDNVTTVENRAFYGCTSLTSVIIPNSVTYIDNQVFYNCTSLTSIDVDVDNTVYCSEDGIMYNKNKSELICYPRVKTGTVTIPDSVVVIGDYAFQNCTSLVDITIPDSVTNIRSNVFQNCTGLTNITIPSSVANIASGAFTGCSNLTSINVDVGNAVYSSVDGIVYNKDKSTLMRCPPGKTNVVTIPDSVTSIEGFAFPSSASLANATIPVGVTSIGDYAFQNCTNLTSVTFAGTITATNFGLNTFFRMGDLRDKFYSEDSDNGTPGTYTTTAPVTETSVWTKQ